MTDSPHELDPETGLPVGPRVPDPSPAPAPERVTLQGRYSRLEPLSAERHGDALFAISADPELIPLYRYLYDDATGDRAEFNAWMERSIASDNPLGFAVIDEATGKTGGRAFLLSIEPAHRSIEVGNILFGPDIARTRVSTEAIFLFLRYAFDDLGYRRFEWKCDSLNGPSRNAALRFGFVYEGLFRRHRINSGRNRDTTWFAIIDEDWPQVRQAFETWLAPENFDDAGRQRHRLADLIADAKSGAR